ncbi:HEAT repeat domain-containing protein [Spirosoma taeanense]|uniref:HEAT repeat domain-containing protein n=1 Tax=Spirosoma taeanense TaxID=2735870 RepID=A0A6M5YBS8_9BACT|nr:HEAT repeat domain-containing protein [Spirosoma taeanense]QJW91475.1 HEAT repeat domain-containing protein [Spirosoma taeanense]
MEAKPMNCDEANLLLADWLSNQMPEQERESFDAHLAQCPACREELSTVRQLWQRMGKLPVPEPSDVLRIRFQAMLDTYKDTVATEQKSWVNGLVRQLRQRWTDQPALRVAYSLALVLVGVVAGYWFHQHSGPTVAYQQQIDTLSTQVQEMRQMMLLSLIDDPSATERLRAVSYTNEIRQADDKVVAALLTTLNNDSNVNVRLVTLEALAKLADDPKVREGLVQSIARQDSPLVQSALADVMVKLQEKRSIKPFRQLLRDDNLNGLVKNKIEQSIRELS